jgi:Txe/YoeB family toxin of Txe-Axe toxin-antitoxin module
MNALKYKTIIKDIQKDPFSGLGKPEALTHDLSGLRSGGHTRLTLRADCSNNKPYSIPSTTA